MKKSIKDVVLATDFSEASRDAEAYTLWMKEELACRLSIIHVFDPASLFMPAPYYFMAGVDKWVDDHLLVCRERGTKSLDQLSEKFGADVTTRFIEGRPGKEIVNYVHKHDADLVVLGTHGHTGWNRLVLGSVAEYVVRHACCPVMTIKPS